MMLQSIYSDHQLKSCCHSDSEIAAQSLGVNLGLYKALSFAISGAFTGLAGALLVITLPLV